MRLVTITSKGEGRVQFVIYENENEVKEAGIKYKIPYWAESTDKPDLEIGDYILTDNGYYIPIRKIYHQLYEKRQRETYRYRCPMYEFNLSRNIITGKCFRSTITYNPDAKQAIRKSLNKVLSPNRKYLIALLKNGLDFTTAVKAAYPRDTTKAFDYILNDNDFIQLLIMEGHMKQLQQEMIDAGITGAYFANKVKEILDDEKSGNDLKKHCLTIAKDILSKDGTAEIEKKVQSEKIDISSIRGKIMEKQG